MLSALYKTTLAAALLLTGTITTAAGYPEDYRSWTHVKTLTLHAGHPLEVPFKGIHHVYANPAALEGLRSGSYPDGAVLVFDLLEAVSADHATAEGKRILLGVMEKNRSQHTATGGWDFDAWAGDSHSERLVKDDGQSCFACHTSQQDNDYVFSTWRD
ncbi:MAG: cytochrome P460 family protein [Gammaproteobacteria bacterium]